MPGQCLSHLAAPDGGCRSHLPGHRMPRLLVEVVSRTPWGWRRGTVVSVSTDGWMLLDCRDADVRAPVHAWHHTDLAAQLPPGTQVRLHQRGGRHDDAPLGLGPAALSGPAGLVSLHVAQGPPPVPDPVTLDTWADDASAVVIDLRTREPLTAVTPGGRGRGPSTGEPPPWPPVPRHGRLHRQHLSLPDG